MEQWEYYVANLELNEIEGRYTWVCSIGRETIVGLPPLLKRFGIAGWDLISLIPLRQTTVATGPAMLQVETLMATFKRRLATSEESPSLHQSAPAIKGAGDDVDGGRHNAPKPEPDAPLSETHRGEAQAG